MRTFQIADAVDIDLTGRRRYFGDEWTVDWAVFVPPLKLMETEGRPLKFDIPQRLSDEKVDAAIVIIRYICKQGWNRSLEVAYALLSTDSESLSIPFGVL